MSACLLCGASGYTDPAEHQQSTRHQLAGARVAIAVADGRWARGVKCPWCDPPPYGRRQRKCRNPQHAEWLAEARRLAAANIG
jgi:hypothetical protein